jgi:hypothetical protein
MTMPKEGVADATVDIDKVKPYADEELEKVEGDRGDTHAEEKEEQEEKDEEKAEEKAEEEVEEKAEKEEDKEEEEEPQRDRKGRFLKSPMVPKARLDEVLRAKEESDAALRELTTLIESEFGEGKKTDGPSEVETLESEISEFEKAHAKALKDGDEESAARIAAAIRQRERQIYRMEATALSNSAREQAREEVRTDQVVARIEQMYPALNPDMPEEYDDDLAEEVRVLRNGLVKSGMRLSEATAKAVNYVMRGIEPKGEEKKPEARKTNLREKVEAAKKQPAGIGKTAIGADHDKVGADLKAVDVAKLTDKEFDALPDSVRARLRGDLA